MTSRNMRPGKEAIGDYKISPELLGTQNQSRDVGTELGLPEPGLPSVGRSR